MRSLNFISFLVLIASISIQDEKFLLALLFIQLSFFLFTRNSISIFLKRVVFIIPALFGVLVLNHKIFPLVILKSTISLWAISVMTSNFDIGKVGPTLKRFHIPDYLGEIFILAFRYSHTFVDEIKLIKKNLWLRGSFTQKHIFKSSFLGPLIGNLFLRSLKKSEKVHQAMKLRGY